MTECYLADVDKTPALVVEQTDKKEIQVLLAGRASNEWLTLIDSSVERSRIAPVGSTPLALAVWQDPRSDVLYAELERRISDSPARSLASLDALLVPLVAREPLAPTVLALFCADRPALTRHLFANYRIDTQLRSKKTPLVRTYARGLLIYDHVFLDLLERNCRCETAAWIPMVEQCLRAGLSLPVLNHLLARTVAYGAECDLGLARFLMEQGAEAKLTPLPATLRGQLSALDFELSVRKAWLDLELAPLLGLPPCLATIILGYLPWPATLLRKQPLPPAPTFSEISWPVPSATPAAEMGFTGQFSFGPTGFSACATNETVFVC